MGVLVAVRVVPRERWHAPGVETAGVHVLLDGEEDPVAADEAVAVVVETVVVTGQLEVRCVQELVELVLVWQTKITYGAGA